MTALLAHVTLAPGQHVPWVVLHPLPLLALVGASVLYARAVRILRARGRRTPGWQQASFYTGLALVAIGLLSILDPLGEQFLLSAHMAQHLLLADIPGPLLLIGVRAPVLYFFWPRPVLVAAARTRVLRATWSVLTRPPVALGTWLVALYAWHTPVAYDAALDHASLHVAEHLCFAFAGMLAWWPLLDPTHHRAEGRLWKAFYVVLCRTVGGVMGIVMLVWPHQLYTAYGNASLRYGISPVHDQQIAGGLMMTVDFVVVTAGFFFFLSRLGDDTQEDEPATAVPTAPAATVTASRERALAPSGGAPTAR